MGDFDTGMTFVSGADTNIFTRTPAQVPKGYPHLKSTLKPHAHPAHNGNGGAAAPSSSSPPRKKSKGAHAFAVPARPKKTRRVKGPSASSRPIPRGPDECDDADRKLIEMVEADADWKDIRAEWKRNTGVTAAASTLPNRYARLKCALFPFPLPPSLPPSLPPRSLARTLLTLTSRWSRANFTVLREEDIAILIAAKREVEDAFELQKWELVSQVMQKNGSEEYPHIVLKRQYKKMMVSGGAIPPEGVEDPDFTIPELGSDDEPVRETVEEDSDSDSGDDED
jgi:hypothetical protein